MKSQKYYRWTTYRRKMLDFLQEEYKYLYHGVVLDIGGRDRGNFKKPRDKVEKWIFADINSEYSPDIILDITNMKEIESNSIDVVNAIELFEHVEEIEKGLKECYRVLKNEGIFIISMPFLAHIHADPYDYQRWTVAKWKTSLTQLEFKIEKFIIMGKYFTFLSESLKYLLRSFETPKMRGKKLLNLFFPFLNFMICLDNKKFVKRNKILNKYHNGYFIIVKK